MLLVEYNNVKNKDGEEGVVIYFMGIDVVRFFGFLCFINEERGYEFLCFGLLV